MIFSVAELISQLSQDTTLPAGTVTLTGTPEGVGFTRKPPLYLKPGDKVEIRIENMGSLINYVPKHCHCQVNFVVEDINSLSRAFNRQSIVKFGSLLTIAQSRLRTQGWDQ
ncbi:hypothetical protein AC1031_003012 [Aphanomyces cochlioides]|nr:hypothetical protein AC1031_003012 [Aphanomyces cochlioides]